jgi:hypothetical protein
MYWIFLLSCSIYLKSYTINEWQYPVIQHLWLQLILNFSLIAIMFIFFCSFLITGIIDRFHYYLCIFYIVIYAGLGYFLSI